MPVLLLDMIDHDYHEISDGTYEVNFLLFSLKFYNIKKLFCFIDVTFEFFIV